MRRDGLALDLEPGLRNALGTIPRVPCPDLAFETLVGRWHHRRLMRLLGGLFAALVAGVAGIGILSTRPDQEAPVNLRLRLVDGRSLAPGDRAPGDRAPGERGDARAPDGRGSDWDGLVEGLPAEVQAP